MPPLSRLMRASGLEVVLHFCRYQVILSFKADAVKVCRQAFPLVLDIVDRKYCFGLFRSDRFVHIRIKEGGNAGCLPIMKVDDIGRI